MRTEKQVQMEQKSEKQQGGITAKLEKQFPYKAMCYNEEVEVLAEHRGWAFCSIKDPEECLAVRIENLKPLPEKPLSFGEWCAENKLDDIRAAAAFFDSGIEKKFQEAYDQYQDYLKTFEKSGYDLTNY